MKTTRNTEVKNHRKEFIKLLEKAAGRFGTWNVFSDFLQLAALSLSNSSDIYHIMNGEKIWNEREENYLRIVNRYSENERKLFPQIFSELILELEDACKSRYRDVLGEIFHEMEFHDKWKGQFFTPQSVSDMMGEIVLNDSAVEEKIAQRGFITINEPCCGAGSIILGAMNAMKELGLNPCKQALIFATDIDLRCVCMCYIQLSFYGVPAVVTQKDALSDKVYNAPFFTPVYILDGWSLKSRRAFNSVDDTAEKAESTRITSRNTELLGNFESAQLTLF